MNFRISAGFFGMLFLIGTINVVLATQTQVADPTLSIAQGTSNSTARVTVNDATSGATIYYTTNGTNPTTSSSSISPGGNIVINLSTTLKVQAYQGTNNPSDVITVVCTANGIISSSNGHTVILKNDGSVWSWGTNASGQLGLGNTTPTPLPTPISEDATQSNFTNVAPIVGTKGVTIPYENGLSIPFEIQYYGATGQNPNSVPNGNGLTLLQDSQQGNDPTDYFSQGGKIITPVIKLVSGAAQSGAAGALLPQPLIVSVTNPAGGNMTSAPITFTVPTGQGQLSANSNGSNPSNSVSATTNSSGQAQVYIILPSSGSTVTITAAALPTTVSAQYLELVPNLPSGLIAWYKGDTLVAGSGGVVSSWPDSSATNATASQSVSNSPTLATDPESGLQELQFNGSQWLNTTGTPNYTSLSDATIIVAAAASAPSDVQEGLIEIGRGLDGNTNTSAYAYGYNSGNQAFLNGWPNNSYNFTNGGSVNPTSGLTVSSVVYSNSNSSVNFYKDGQINNPTQGPPSVSVTPINPRQYLSIGSLADYYAALGWNGEIAEILVFNTALTTTQRQQVELYLANKYLTYAPGATWISNYSSNVQTQINQNRWSKAQADQYVLVLNTVGVGQGPIAWFKADSTFVPNSSGTTIWHDSSGNNNDVSQSNSGNQPTLSTDPLSGQPEVSFNGSQYLYASNGSLLAGGNDDTIIIVGSDSNPNTYSTYVTVGNADSPPGARELAINSNDNQAYFDGTNAAAGGQAQVGSTLTINSSGSRGTYSATLNVSSLTYSQSAATVNFYSEGAQNGTVSGISSGNLTSGLTLGCTGGGFQSITGNIAEVLIYNSVLTQAQREQVELYLAQKYNIPYNLPAPTITPNGGTASTSISVTLSTSPSPVFTRYTLDGTTPTATSPLYTNSLTLTQSAPLTCAYFLNNTIISPTSTAQFYVNDYLYNGADTGISNAWITQYNLSNIQPSQLVSGGSGLTYLQAYLWGYNPTMYSTNGDGLSDLENRVLGYSATNTDINNYGLTNAQQLALGLDPFDTNINPPQGPTPTSNPGTTLTIQLFNPQGAVQVQ